MAAPDWQYRSSVPGVGWPAIPGGEPARLLTLLFQLERSQWLAPEELRELQFLQLAKLLRHAYDTVPYYRERWQGFYDPREPLTAERLSRLPMLARGDLQGHFDALHSTDIPAAHKPVAEACSAGSTGAPVRVTKSALTQILWRAVSMREHAWHGRNLLGKHAAIRHGIEAGQKQGWGPPASDVARTGPSVQLPASVPVHIQLRWLEEHSPDYLLTYPSNLAELLRLSVARGARIPGLREVRTLGEVVSLELRESCMETWGAPVVDAYSAQEGGYMAMQCPKHDHYHVQSETVMLEVVDPDGRACAPGEVGLVVVTPLHNFAMPLVRYVQGDYAEAGGRCDCGRGLPVLSRILGRVRPS